MEDILATIFLFILGLLLLIKGGDVFVDNAVIIAKKFNLPELLIGATVVSIGTTLPEVMVSATGALEGNGAIAYGNAIGSIICNTALISAITIAVAPSVVNKKDLVLPTIFFVIATTLYCVISYTTGYFSRTIGIILVGLFVIYMILQIRNALKDKNVHAMIMGTGSLKDELEGYSKDMENVHFLGFTEYPKMAAMLSKSDVVVNSFVKGAPQSIVNKVGDYLASGKPMINTLENPVFCKLVEENGVGVNVEPGNVEALIECIELLREDNGFSKKFGENARIFAEKRFDRKITYPRLGDIVEKVCENSI